MDDGGGIPFSAWMERAGLHWPCTAIRAHACKQTVDIEKKIVLKSHELSSPAPRFSLISCQLLLIADAKG